MVFSWSNFGWAPSHWQEFALRCLLDLDIAAAPMRLRRRAAAFHRYCGKEKRRAIRKYLKGANIVGRTTILKRGAAHVAAWIAYLPKGQPPQVDELLLLGKYLDRLGRLVPSRLQQILPRVQAVVQDVGGDHSCDAVWHEARYQLQHSLERFRCCRGPRFAVWCPPSRSDRSQSICVAADGAAVADKGSSAQAMQTNSISVLPRASEQHLRLFRRMNEWVSMNAAEKLERLKALRDIGKVARKGLSETKLAEAIYSVAAGLSAPRRHAAQKGLEDTLTADGAPASSLFQKEAGVQHHVRVLLLDMLRAWQARQFDSHVIQCVLEYIQTKISKFEDNVGAVASAAAGTMWLSIKHAVEELLQRPEQHVSSERRNSAWPTERQLLDHDCEDNVQGLRRLERQSGTEGIAWHRLSMGWRVSWYDEGRRKWKVFSILKLLREGVDEGEAVQQALSEARAHHQELVRQDKLRPPKRIKTSSVRGVDFHKATRKWRAALRHPVTKKNVHGGYFATHEEAAAKAREMAGEFGKHPELVVPVKQLSELQHFQPLGPQKGVTWSRNEQCWNAQCYVGDKKRRARFRPRDLSDGEVAKAWKQAVAWRSEQRAACATLMPS